MIIRRIEVRNFRKLVDPVIADGLQAGLTVIVGENEEGKSTLLQALRTVFFDRYNLTGKDAESFQPYNSWVRPEITVSFDLDGAGYTLRKAFCQRPEAELRTPTGTLTGPAVEEKLQELLRFSAPGRGPSNEKHQGIWGLFWVEQGKAFLRPTHNVDSRSTFREALESEVGDVLGGQRGQRILAKIKERHDKFFTSAKKPRGDYAEAQKRTEQLEQELTSVESRLHSYDQKVDQLQRFQDLLAKHQADSSLEKAKAALMRAAEADQRIRKLDQALEETRKAVRVADAEFKLAVANSQQREKEIETVSTTNARVGELQAEVEGKEAIRQSLSDRVERKLIEEKTAQQLFDDASQQLRNCETALQITRLQDAIAKRKQQLKKARTAKAEADRAIASAEAIGIDSKRLAKLKKLEVAVSNYRAQLAAIATTVEIALEKGRTVLVDGNQLPSPVSRRLTELTRIQIPQCAQITIVPGGDLTNLQRETEEASQKLQQALNELSVSNTAEAETRLETRNNLRALAEKQNAIAEAHAPEGLDALEKGLAKDEGALSEVVKRTSLRFGSEAEATSALEKAQNDSASKQKISTESRNELDQSRNELSIENNALSTLKGQLLILRNQNEAAIRQLEKARSEKDDSTLQETLLTAREKLNEARTSEVAAKQALERAEPETVGLQLESARDAVREIEKDIKGLEQSVRDLQTELRALGQFGLGEEKQRIEGELTTARTHEAAIRRKAEAIKLLYRVLTEAEKSAKETFLSPVTKRIQPYLKLLLPGAELKLNEDIDIVGLQRGAIEERFDLLSTGTREQLAVLTRLAFADLLQEKGQSAPVILDDALVNTDDERFERMQLILRKAAKNLQIIVLTWHGRRYQDMGAAIIRLADCRSDLTP